MFKLTNSLSETSTKNWRNNLSFIRKKSPRVLLQTSLSEIIWKCPDDSHHPVLACYFGPRVWILTNCGGVSGLVQHIYNILTIVFGECPNFIGSPGVRALSKSPGPPSGCTLISAFNIHDQTKKEIIGVTFWRMIPYGLVVRIAYCYTEILHLRNHSSDT
jgi:hypothetical protein